MDAGQRMKTDSGKSAPFVFELYGSFRRPDCFDLELSPPEKFFSGLNLFSG
jgi:hypothetical protein